MTVTALTPYIGYEHAARVAHLAHKESITLKDATVRLGLLTEEKFDEVYHPEGWYKNGYQRNFIKKALPLERKNRSVSLPSKSDYCKKRRKAFVAIAHAWVQNPLR